MDYAHGRRGKALWCFSEFLGGERQKGRARPEGLRNGPEKTTLLFASLPATLGATKKEFLESGENLVHVGDSPSQVCREKKLISVPKNTVWVGLTVREL